MPQHPPTSAGNQADIPLVLQKKERKQLIIRQVGIHTRLTFADLVKLIDVSEDTIRRDVNELADEGQVIRIKGGVMTAAYHLGREEATYSQPGKLVIADKTVSLLKQDMIVLTGGGTSIREFIKRIPDDLRATVITVNPLTAVELLDKPQIKTVILGGCLSTYSQMVVTGEVFTSLASLKADLCILGINAIDSENGLTDSDWETVQVKKAMMKAAKQVAVLTISEKLNSSMQIQIAGLNEIDYLVTELDPQHPLLNKYAIPGVTLL
ncbi:MAG: DeoR/GlpR transcriptional regulator [Chitinophagaceae bacterium]|nr:MAG: DeoR/GlpR transcriptional regulator [Chitinophagaceae bacterium]